MAAKQKGYTSADALALRLRLGLNQTEFWTRVGAGQSAGSRYESGRAPPRAVQKLLVIAYGTEAQAQKAVDALRAKGAPNDQHNRPASAGPG